MKGKIHFFSYTWKTNQITFLKSVQIDLNKPFKNIKQQAKCAALEDFVSVVPRLVNNQETNQNPLHWSIFFLIDYWILEFVRWTIQRNPELML